MAVGAVIANSLTKYTLGSGTSDWHGKTNKSVWWNTWQSRWDGVIVYDEAGGLAVSGDHYIVKDVDGTPSWTTIEVDDRGSALYSTKQIYWFCRASH